MATAAVATQEAAPSLAELEKTYAHVQNGSDVRGFAIDGERDVLAVALCVCLCVQLDFSAGVPGEDLNLTPEMAFFMGAAFADMLTQQLGKPASELRVSVRACCASDDALKGLCVRLVWMQIGRDPRLSGPELLNALAAGVNSRGANAADFGLATTPAMFMSCILPGAQAGSADDCVDQSRGIICMCTQQGQFAAAGGFSALHLADNSAQARLETGLLITQLLTSSVACRARVQRGRHDYSLPPALQPQRLQVHDRLVHFRQEADHGAAATSRQGSIRGWIELVPGQGLPLWQRQARAGQPFCTLAVL